MNRDLMIIGCHFLWLHNNHLTTNPFNYISTRLINVLSFFFPLKWKWKNSPWIFFILPQNFFSLCAIFHSFNLCHDMRKILNESLAALWIALKIKHQSDSRFAFFAVLCFRCAVKCDETIKKVNNRNSVTSQSINSFDFFAVFLPAIKCGWETGAVFYLWQFLLADVSLPLHVVHEKRNGKIVQRLNWLCLLHRNLITSSLIQSNSRILCFVMK